MTRGLKVMMFPGRGNPNENRYIDILVSGLRAQGCTVIPFHKHLETQSADIFHVHWPEVFAGIRLRPWQKLRGDVIGVNFKLTIDRIRRSGGRLVWTVHDLDPHDSRLVKDPYYQRLMEMFEARVDGLISLTERGVPQIRAHFPAVVDRPVFVTPHPHYREDSLRPRPAERSREMFGLPEGDFVFGLLGTLRPNKGAAELIRAFRAWPSAGASLLVAGSVQENYARTLQDLAAGDRRIVLKFGRLSDEMLLKAHDAIDVLVFPASNYFNSGTVLKALSLDVPVLAYATPANREIEKSLSPAWMQLFDGALDGSVLEGMRQARQGIARGESCNLDAFAPELVAQRTIEAYRALLARGG